MAPASKPPLDPAHIRSPAFDATIAKLPAIGEAKRIPGEAWAAENKPKQAPLHKADAKVRMFCFSGLGGFAMSLRDWWVPYNAPKWIEIRPLEFPGHGWREEETLPFFPGSKSEPKNFTADGAEADYETCRSGRAAEISAIADDLMPMLDKPYAIYGFCSGAVHAYLLTKELERRGAPKPLRLFESCCAPPHTIQGGMQKDDLPKILGWDDEMTIKWAIEGGALPPASERVWEPTPQFAKIARSDAILAGIVVGDQSPGDKDAKTGILYASNLPKVTTAPIVAIGGSDDHVSPADKFLHRWEDAAGAGFRSKTIPGVAHEHLMCHEATRDEVYGELAVALKELAEGDSVTKKLEAMTTAPKTTGYVPTNIVTKKPDGTVDNAVDFLKFAETPHLEPAALGDWAAFVAAAKEGRTQALDYLKGPCGMSKLADRQKVANASQKCVRAGSLEVGPVALS